MSSLHESVSLRRAAEPTGLSCVTLGVSQPGMVVAPWTGASWMLPWSYLVNARFTEPPGELELSYTTHVVIAEGDNLRRVLDEVALFRVSCLRDMPDEYRQKLPTDAPFIRRLIVRQAAPPTSGAEKTNADANGG